MPFLCDQIYHLKFLMLIIEKMGVRDLQFKNINQIIFRQLYSQLQSQCNFLDTCHWCKFHENLNIWSDVHLLTLAGRIQFVLVEKEKTLQKYDTGFTRIFSYKNMLHKNSRLEFLVKINRSIVKTIEKFKIMTSLVRILVFL